MIYSSVIQSKDGLVVPIFTDGKPFHSKYAPQKEASRIVQSAPYADFFLVAGMGAGYVVKELLERFPDSRIAVIENSIEDINFLCQNCPIVQELKNKSEVFLLTKDSINSELPKLFIPAKFPSFFFLESASWAFALGPQMQDLRKAINFSLSTISADFSVQAHFGKLWTRNILENIRTASSITFAKQHVTWQDFFSKTKKTATVVAAGPSLDKILSFADKRAELCDTYIIATDTAYSSLLAYGVQVDAVVSIDGQHISKEHFSEVKKYLKNAQKTLFVFDLSANPIAARHCKKTEAPVIFTNSANPLAILSSELLPGTFPKLDTSSGTVTIAAADFARLLGFSSIKIIGADFGYTDGKPYAKGTYLDHIYGKSQTKIFTAEQQFAHIMFRTELKKVSLAKYTTEVLLRYEQELFNWAKKNEYKITKKTEDDIEYFSLFCTKDLKNKITEPKNFSYTDFCQALKKTLQNSQFDQALLPYIAFLRNKDSILGKTSSFSELSIVALNFILRYTHNI